MSYDIYINNYNVHTLTVLQVIIFRTQKDTTHTTLFFSFLSLNSYTDKVPLIEAPSNEDTLIRSLNLRDFKPNLMSAKASSRDRNIPRPWLSSDGYITEESRGSE